MNNTLDSVFDAEEAEDEEEALVNQVFDEIGLEFTESVRKLHVHLSRLIFV